MFYYFLRARSGLRNREKEEITTEIDKKVEDTLNEWFGVEYELIKG